MKLKPFPYYPLIPLQTPQLTLTGLENTKTTGDNFLSSGAHQFPLQDTGVQADTLLFRVALTDEQTTLGFAQVGSILYYHSLSPSHPLGSMTELLRALLIFSFFVLNKTAIQLLPQQVDNPLADACTALDLPRSLMQISGQKRIVVQRDDFYQRHLVTTIPFTWAVVALLLRADGAILLSQPPASKRVISSWELPGGKVATGESPALALVRELQEELGITVSPASLMPLIFATDCFSQPPLLVHGYLGMAWSHEPAAQEQQTLAWVLPEQIHHYPMQVAHQVAFYQLAVLLGRYSLQWAQYANRGPVLCASVQ